MFNLDERLAELSRIDNEKKRREEAQRDVNLLGVNFPDEEDEDDEDEDGWNELWSARTTE